MKIGKKSPGEGREDRVYRYVLAGTAVLWAILLGLATVWDLQATEALYNPSSGIGRFCNIFGGWPAAFCGLVAPALFAETYPFRKGARGVAAKCALYALSAGGGTAVIYVPGHYAYHTRLSPLVVLLGGLLAVLVVMAAQRLPRRLHETAWRVALAVFLALLFELFMVNTLKHVWGRERFIQMRNPAGEFTPWFRVGPPDGGRSFPSGHTGNAAMIFAAVGLARFPGMKRLRLPLFFAALGWTVFVGIGRMVAGMHFPSDVLMSALISGGGCLFMDGWMFRRRTKESVGYD
ncbi:phosphatase PAP2 family protein [Oscillospiraceae bacterium OttesenSCG-928-F05]|nr:phosphatase PAP2 family protein [Oscillospiraceae bacterium OttesenSCG-928-F05]